MVSQATRSAQGNGVTLNTAFVTELLEQVSNTVKTSMASAYAAEKQLRAREHQAMTQEIKLLTGQVTSLRSVVEELSRRVHVEESSGGNAQGVAAQRDAFESPLFQVAVPLRLTQLNTCITAGGTTLHSFASMMAMEQLALKCHDPTTADWAVMMFQFARLNGKGASSSSVRGGAACSHASNQDRVRSR